MKQSQVKHNGKLADTYTEEMWPTKADFRLITNNGCITNIITEKVCKLINIIAAVKQESYTKCTFNIQRCLHSWLHCEPIHQKLLIFIYTKVIKPLPHTNNTSSTYPNHTITTSLKIPWNESTNSMNQPFRNKSMHSKWWLHYIGSVNYDFNQCTSSVVRWWEQMI